MLYPTVTISVFSSWAAPASLSDLVETAVTSFLETLMCYTSWASSTAGDWPLAAVPDARSSFLLVLSIGGTCRNASSKNKDAGLHYL